MVVVSGIMGQTDASDARTLEGIETGRVQLALSDDWLRELHDVLSRAFLVERNPKPARAFRVRIGR